MKKQARFVSTLCFVLSIVLVPASIAKTPKHAPVKDEYVFKPTDNAMADVEASLATAKVNNKRLIVVLGAQWCHDSRGLASRFSTSDMQQVLKEHYETVFVDVGFLNDLRPITQRFDYPSYFATPTVMIIDPSTEALVNRESMPKWAFADSIELSDYVTYFSEHAALSAPEYTAKDNNQIGQLALFAQAQAERLQNAYQLIGPMLEQDEAGNPPEGFYDKWNQVRRFRIKVQNDLMTLYPKARANQPLALPSYESFSWDQ